MKKFAALISILIVLSFLAGCGETVHGVVKDTRRVGTGIRTIFVRD